MFCCTRYKVCFKGSQGSDPSKINSFDLNKRRIEQSNRSEKNKKRLVKKTNFATETTYLTIV